MFILLNHLETKLEFFGEALVFYFGGNSYYD